jgi:hypothetical protein
LVAAKCGSSEPWFDWNTMVSVSLLDFCAGTGAAAAGALVAAAAGGALVATAAAGALVGFDAA